MPILLADRMHCTYREVLNSEARVVFLYLNLMTAEAQAEKDMTRKAAKHSRRKR